MSAARSDQDYSYKTDFEIWRENQEFEHQNISMSRPPLELTPLGMKTTKGTASPIDSIPVKTKTQEPTSLTPPTEFP